MTNDITKRKAEQYLLWAQKLRYLIDSRTLALDDKTLAALREGERVFREKHKSFSVEKTIRPDLFYLDELEEGKDQEALAGLRKSRAVKQGNRVYLPLPVLKGSVPMPYVFLRSSLFSIKDPTDSTSEYEVHVPDNAVSMSAKGPILGNYDRNVFAALSLLFRMEPLTDEGERNRIKVTRYELIKFMGRKPGQGAYEALDSSLKRLAQIQLKINNGKETQVFDGLLDYEREENEGKVSYELSLNPMLAKIYGWGWWISVSVSSLNKLDALSSWLACFGVTHSEAKPLDAAYIAKHAGSAATPAEFRRNLKKAVVNLQGQKDKLNLGEVTFDADSNKLLIRGRRASK